MKPFFRHLWPLLVLLTVEAVAFGWLFSNPATRPPEAITPFSATISILVLLTGLLPAVLRPNPESALAGCLASLLVGLLVIPFHAGDVPARLTVEPALTAVPAYVLLRLANGVAIGPVALHLAARFRRSGLANPAIAVSYAGTAQGGALLQQFSTTINNLTGQIASGQFPTAKVGLGEFEAALPARPSR